MKSRRELGLKKKEGKKEERRIKATSLMKG
jgi:hypothetical protein